MEKEIKYRKLKRKLEEKEVTCVHISGGSRIKKGLLLFGALGGLLALSTKRVYAEVQVPVYYPYLPELTLSPPETFPIISADEISGVIIGHLGEQWIAPAMLLTTDEWYRLPTDEVVSQFVGIDITDQLEYIDTAFDCDDFADVLQGVFERSTYGYGFCFGKIFWCSLSAGIAHAQNIYINSERVVKLVEPQNDQIQTWGDILSKFPDAKPMLVIF